MKLRTAIQRLLSCPCPLLIGIPYVDDKLKKIQKEKLIILICDSDRKLTKDITYSYLKKSQVKLWEWSYNCPECLRSGAKVINLHDFKLTPYKFNVIVAWEDDYVIFEPPINWPSMELIFL